MLALCGPRSAGGSVSASAAGWSGLPTGSSRAWGMLDEEAGGRASATVGVGPGLGGAGAT